MTFKTSDGAHLYYTLAGNPSQDPIVLIHGLGVDHQMWEPQMATYHEKGFFLLVPDIRGHGESSQAGVFSIGTCARDIAELLEHRQVQKAHIVGVSMGGVIAQKFACDYGEMVSTLVISDSFSEVSTFTERERLAGWLQWLIIKIVPGLLIKSLSTAYQGPEKAWVRNYFKSSFGRVDKKQLLEARKELNKFNITDRLAEIEAPTLVLVGNDFGAFAINMAQKTACKIR